MTLFDTVKAIVTDHDAKRYQPIHISSPNWEEPGPLFATREEAQRWLDDKIARGKPRDWGYVVDVAPLQASGKSDESGEGDGMK